MRFQKSTLFNWNKIDDYTWEEFEAWFLKILGFFMSLELDMF